MRDETVRAIAAKGGVIGLCVLPRLVWPRDQTLARRAELVQHGFADAEIHGILGRDFLRVAARAWT